MNQLPGTKLLAAHDLALIRDTCSRVIVMDAGRIVAEGPTDLMRDVELMERHGLEAI